MECSPLRKRHGETGWLTAVWACAMLALASGCAGVVAEARKSLRAPGEQLRELPEAVAAEYDCADKVLPHLEIEGSELLPERLRPGEELNHRLIYALCPTEPTEVVRGNLETRIRHKGEAFVIDRITGYELKPGRWVIDAFIELPTDAETGVYALEVAFQSPELSFEESITFAVDGKLRIAPPASDGH